MHKDIDEWQKLLAIYKTVALITPLKLDNILKGMAVFFRLFIAAFMRSAILFNILFLGLIDFFEQICAAKLFKKTTTFKSTFVCFFSEHKVLI